MTIEEIKDELIKETEQLKSAYSEMKTKMAAIETRLIEIQGAYKAFKKIEKPENQE